jgi:anti-sigma B factor antagonist
MKLTTESFGAVTVIHTPEDLNERMGGAIRDAVRSQLSQGRRAIVLDMTATESFDSFGLTSLLDVKDSAVETGGDLKICGLTQTGLKIFALTRLDHQFELFESLIDAVKSNS